MAVSKKNSYGEINISLDAIAIVACDAALECYGVRGIAPRSYVHEVIGTILKQDNFAKGIVVDKIGSSYSVKLYLVIARNVKITEVLAEVQKKVKYDLEKTFGIKIKKLDVYANDLVD